MIVSSVVAGVASIIAALIGVRNHAKLTEIHVLVNARLDSALMEIADLKSNETLNMMKRQSERCGQHVRSWGHYEGGPCGMPKGHKDRHLAVNAYQRKLRRSRVRRRKRV